MWTRVRPITDSDVSTICGDNTARSQDDITAEHDRPQLRAVAVRVHDQLDILVQVVSPSEDKLSITSKAHRSGTGRILTDGRPARARD